jgi:outer membrane biosynthesis protein TonB
MVDLVMLESSGYPDIDEAVLFGFRQASFRNASKFTVKAQFTYSFEGRD